MNQILEEITARIREIDKDDRARILDSIQRQQADFDEAQIEQAWLTEADRRWTEIESGKTDTSPACPTISMIETDYHRTQAPKLSPHLIFNNSFSVHGISRPPITFFARVTVAASIGSARCSHSRRA